MDKKKKVQQYMNQRSGALCNVIARANTIGEIKEMLSGLGCDDDKVLFKNNSNYIEFISVAKAKFNKNAEQRPSENPLPIELIDGILITMG